MDQHAQAPLRKIVLTLAITLPDAAYQDQAQASAELVGVFNDALGTSLGIHDALATATAAVGQTSAVAAFLTLTSRLMMARAAKAVTKGEPVPSVFDPAGSRFGGGTDPTLFVLKAVDLGVSLPDASNDVPAAPTSTLEA